MAIDKLNLVPYQGFFKPAPTDIPRAGKPPEKTAIEEIPVKNNLIERVIPKITLPDPVKQLKQATQAISPGLLLKTFGLQALQTSIFRGRIPVTESDSPIRISKLGTGIFSDLQFTEIDGTEHIPVDTCLFIVTQNKNIVKTEINGRDGSIKEYMGLSDYEINCKGLICGSNGKFPWDEAANLILFLTTNQSVGITSAYLNDLFGVTEVVITKFTVEQVEGSNSQFKFDLDMLSEKPVEVLISEAQEA